MAGIPHFQTQNFPGGENGKITDRVERPRHRHVMAAALKGYMPRNLRSFVSTSG
jgi:hypothetical protein